MGGEGGGNEGAVAATDVLGGVSACVEGLVGHGAWWLLMHGGCCWCCCAWGLWALCAPCLVMMLSVLLVLVLPILNWVPLLGLCVRLQVRSAFLAAPTRPIPPSAPYSPPLPSHNSVASNACV